VRQAGGGGVVAELIGVPLDGGGVVVMEIEAVPDGRAGGVLKARRPGEVVGQAVRSLDEAMEPVAAAARSVVAKLREASPDEVTVEFGVQFSAELGAVITRTAGACNLKVTLRWDRADDRSG
jgi:hypothetical protein